MNNLTIAQTNILSKMVPVTKPNGAAFNSIYRPNVYVVGQNATGEELNALAASTSGEVFYFSPTQTLPAGATALNIKLIESKLTPLPAAMLVIDGHQDYQQSDVEKTVLGGFQAQIKENQPFIFIRNEDPDRSDAILEMFFYMNYIVYWAYRDDVKTNVEIWMFAVPKEVAWEAPTAYQESHPKKRQTIDLDPFELKILQ